MLKFNKKKLFSNWRIYYLATLFLVAFLFHFSPELEAKKNSIPVPANAGSFPGLVKKASPSVVNISAVRVLKAPEQSPFPFGSDDPLKQFFEKFFRQQLPREFRQNSLGTGFFIEIDQVSITDREEFKRRVEGLAKGAIVLFLVDREGSTIYITLRIW